MAFVDYYKILGVSKDIPQKDVKKAYLKRAKQFHPDLHQGPVWRELEASRSFRWR